VVIGLLLVVLLLLIIIIKKDLIIMIHLYFFRSSRANDVITNLTIGTSNPVRAYVLACKYFINNKAKGKPKMLAI
jgi:hypothetical protein